MRFEILTKQVPMGNKVFEFKYMPHPGAVVIAAEQNDRVALLSQYRPAVNERIWELPAGTLEADEAPQVCAGRELTEETGFRAARVQPLGTFYPAPGYCTEKLFLFLARDLTPGPTNREESEDIDEVAWFTLAEAEDMIRTGTVRDAKTIAGIYYWRLHREQEAS